ncbi:SDR family NAD(P)-dependent oxidoreductase [Rhodococcus sp. 114MFTsu3.1]|uniref:SDR family NAD(P)-dependent oxidoreductase n=1 Tax=Rhodococcus sp. 114MFTsu3.1 TaxID=1172184 RepID=UPI0018C8FF5C|nr:SDR family NAD(P)-dependent oxidoreductase [Rhodococcus sp. 114MFTsu3.1]
MTGSSLNRESVVVITGAATGIGRAMTLSFVARGARVVVADIDDAAAAALVAEVSELGGTAFAERVDVSKAESVERLADSVFSQHGRVDVLCNNAGVSMRPHRASWNASIRDFAWAMEVNYFGVVHGIVSFVPRMRAQPGHKHMVNTSSVTALDIAPGHAPYAASKAAVTALSDALRYELEDHDDDFGVTVLYPGLVPTSIATSERLRPDSDRSAVRNVIAYEPERAATLTYNLPVAAETLGELAVEAVETGQNAVLTHGYPGTEIEARLQDLRNGASDRTLQHFTGHSSKEHER